MNLSTKTSTSMVALALLGAAPVHAQESEPARFQDCPNCPQMVVVPAGEFMRGSPQDEPGRSLDPRNHDEDDLEGPGGKRVRVSVPSFVLGVYEVTNGQFARFLEDTDYPMPTGCISDVDGDGVWGPDEAGTWNNLGREHRQDHPASCIDRPAATAYVHWLSLRTGARYRLPTEAEFEYALRAGSDTVYHFGDDPERLCEYGNVPDESRNAVSPELITATCTDGYADMAPVGQYKPNAFGLHDLTGNVWEWLQDCYERSYANVPTDGTALHRDDCSAYSIRGGSWGYDLPSLRSADRSDDPPDILYDGIGFRVARDLVPEPDVPDWDLRVFENASHGVSVLYPASYKPVDDADTLFSVASPYGVPRMDIGLTTDALADVESLARAHVASLSNLADKKGVSTSSGGAVPEPVVGRGVTTRLGETDADQVSIDWSSAESKAELRTLVLSVADDGGRITLFLTGYRKNDWEDLTRLAHTLRVAR